MTLYHSTFRWFDASSCKATPVVQLTTVSTILITACRTFTLTDVLLLGTLWAFGGLRERSPLALRQGECGSKTAEMHVNQPMTHRRV